MVAIAAATPIVACSSGKYRSRSVYFWSSERKVYRTLFTPEIVAVAADVVVISVWHVAMMAWLILYILLAAWFDPSCLSKLAVYMLG